MVLARRDQTYIPQHFWSVIFTLKGSAIPTVMPRSIPLIVIDILAAVLSDKRICERGCGEGGWSAGDCEAGERVSCATYFAVPSEVIIPFALLIGLLFSFRISSAYEKWVHACGITKQYHGRVYFITSRLAISLREGTGPLAEGRFVPGGGRHAADVLLSPCAADTLPMVQEVRRLLLLSFVCMLKDMHGESGYVKELECGLVRPAEVKAFNSPSTFALRGGGGKGGAGGGKRAGPGRPERMPQSVHAAFAFHLAEQATHEAFAACKLHTSPSRARLEYLFNELATVFDQVELLAMTMLPLEYAQASRLACLVFLALLPFSAVHALQWFVIPIAMLANIVFLCIDESASDMEAPFGMDETDVDLEGAVRATDIQSAAVLGAVYGKPVAHFDLYRPAEQASEGSLERKPSVYELQRRETITKLPWEATKLPANSLWRSVSLADVSAKATQEAAPSASPARRLLQATQEAAPSASPARRLLQATQEAAPSASPARRLLVAAKATQEAAPSASPARRLLQEPLTPPSPSATSATPPRRSRLSLADVAAKATQGAAPSASPARRLLQEPL